MEPNGNNNSCQPYLIISDVLKEIDQSRPPSAAPRDAMHKYNRTTAATLGHLIIKSILSLLLLFRYQMVLDKLDVVSMGVCRRV